MAYYDQVVTSLFPKKELFNRYTSQQQFICPAFYEKVTCYRSTVITSIYLYKQQFPHTKEISCWRYPKWRHHNNYCKLWKAINQMWFPLTTSGMNLFLICLWVFFFFIHSTLHNVQHSSPSGPHAFLSVVSLYIKCFSHLYQHQLLCIQCLPCLINLQLFSFMNRGGLDWFSILQQRFLFR